MKALLTLHFFALSFLFLSFTAKAQNYNIVLGRPTDHTVTISALFEQAVEVSVQYGADQVNIDQSTEWFTTEQETPLVIELAELAANTRYYYRLVYRQPFTAVLQYSPLYTFHTQRAVGASFKFLIEADEHLYDKKGVRNLYQVCLQNQARDSADFMFSLGDTFGDDHTPFETSSEDMRELHLDYRQYLGAVCHSMPFYFCLGNHEGESGYWLDQTPPENIAVYGTQWRKFYYPNPSPNDFYSGNTTDEPYGIGYPENYYAFTWGDALFVVLDVYRDCDVEEKPKNWDWTLGEVQYNWLKTTLENSTATHKFVFAHHNRGQGRGGALPARGYEWGGYGNNGNGDWEFDTMRPGWAMPIHQLMVANGVNIFFQGHDHLFAKEEMDGLVYQEVPMPSDSTYEIGVLANADAYTDVTLDGSGHLRVSVTPTCVTVEYIAAYLPADTSATQQNASVRYAYHIGECATQTGNNHAIDSPFFLIFPNPAKEILNIKTNNTEGAPRKIELLNIQGQVLKTTVLDAGANALQMDIAGLPPGIYYVKMAGSVRPTTTKLIIAE